MFATMMTLRINAENAIPLFFSSFLTCRKNKHQGFAWYVHIYTKDYRLLLVTRNLLRSHECQCADTNICPVPCFQSTDVSDPFPPQVLWEHPRGIPFAVSLALVPVQHSWHTVLCQMWHTHLNTRLNILSRSEIRFKSASCLIHYIYMYRQESNLAISSSPVKNNNVPFVI